MEGNAIRTGQFSPDGLTPDGFFSTVKLSGRWSKGWHLGRKTNQGRYPFRRPFVPMPFRETAR